MTDAGNVRVENPSGGTHTGSGNLYNGPTTINYMGFRQNNGDGPTFRTVAEDQLSRQRRVLVAPRNMGQARSVLAESGTVILDGAPGSGRTCAARVLLRECRQGTGGLRELQPEDDEELSLHDPDLVGAGDQLLLDVSTADDPGWARVRKDLPALRKIVHDQQAHLVVVMPHGRGLDSDLQNYRVVISPPAAQAVLRRHLRAHGLPPEEYLQSDGSITEFLRERPMREIAGFADLVRRAREAAPHRDFTHWCEQAKAARDDHRKRVADSVARLREAPQRALMITLAMLHGAHADVIHGAAQLLLRVIGSTSEQPSPLEHKDLFERLDEIAATCDARGRVRFTDLDYDAAVRTHFWDHLPDLRAYLGIWAPQVVEIDDPHMTADARRDLVTRLAGQYLRTERGEALTLLAESWSSTTRSPLSRQAAFEALACGLRDPAQGPRMRKLIYHWCAERQLKGEFRQVLIPVCSQVIATSHPDQALIRLYHLARRERDGTQALQALEELVTGNRRLRRLLLDRLAHFAFMPASLAIFLQVCDPQPLTETRDTAGSLLREDSVQRSLTACWHRVLATFRRTQWHPQAERWFRHAASPDQAGGDLLLDVLVAAADRCEDRRGSAFAALYASARDAEQATGADPGRSAATTELLLTKIRAAQGLEPVTSVRGTRQ